MTRTLESQRRDRATEGHPARQQMLEWSKSAKAKAARAKHCATDAYKEKRSKDCSVGGLLYEKTHAIRKTSRSAATNSRKKWTDTQCEELLELRKLGYTCLQIASVLNRSWQSIEHKVVRLLGKSND